MLSVTELKESLPTKLKQAATQSLVDKFNSITNDPETLEILRGNIISYTSVLMDGRFKTEDYLRAVAYVSFKLMGNTNKESYRRTFPDRWARFAVQGTSDKDISSYVSSYSKNKLVNTIMEQALVPTWVLNQDIYQKAINTQAQIMLDVTASDKVRSDAADSLLNHLKKPESKKVELDIGVHESSAMLDLKETMARMVEKQQELIAQGVPTREIAHQKLGGDIVEGSAKDVTPQHTTAKQMQDGVTGSK